MPLGNMSLPPSLRGLCALAMIFIVSACTFDSTNLSSVQCPEDGSQRDGKICLGGYWTASGVDLDAVTDTQPPIDGGTDTGPDPDVTDDIVIEPDVCIPADDLILCADLGLDCGQVPTTDNCGNARTLFCGECQNGDVCHEDNRCACASQSVGELCALNDAVCGVLTAADACGRERTVQCGPCNGEHQTCVDNQCCQGESNASLCDNAPAIECGTTTLTDSCGAARTVDCGTCSGEGAWQNQGSLYDCCSDDGAETCQCQDEVYLVPDCADNTCTTRIDDTRTNRTGCNLCAGTTCPAFGPCTYDNTCSHSGTQSRNCSRRACEAGACNVVETIPETQDGTCTRSTNGTTCTTSVNCSVGVCASGDCSAQPICSGAATECGCNTCQDCTTQNGNYPTEEDWEPCCFNGQSCECRPFETRSYSCNGVNCAYAVTGTGTERQNCSDCQPEACGDYTECSYDTDCATTGSRTRTCYTATCSGTTCQNTPFIETDTEECNRSTTGTDCTLDSGDTGTCDNSGQCTATVTPTPCAGTITGCGEPGNCNPCPESSTDFKGSAYDCCSGTQLCRCRDQVTTTYTCTSNVCTPQESAPVKTFIDGSCSQCPTNGQKGCKEFPANKTACCVDNFNSARSC